MATDQHADLVYYPAFCFKAAPTHFSWVKLSAEHVHQLHRPPGFAGQKIFFYKNHPIRFVTVVGLIVDRLEIEAAHRTVLLLDDSSEATIEIIALHSPERMQSAAQKVAEGDTGVDNSLAEALGSGHTMHITATDKTGLDISALVPGKVVKIKGTLSQFRDKMQILVEKFSLIQETNEEMKFHEERLRFLVEVLWVPWVLSDEEIELLSRDAEGEEVKAGEQRRRARERLKRRAEREEKDLRRIVRRYESDERRREREAVVCRENGVDVMDGIQRRRGIQ